jgi:hypothetical protein
MPVEPAVKYAQERETSTRGRKHIPKKPQPDQVPTDRLRESMAGLASLFFSRFARGNTPRADSTFFMKPYR